MSQQTNGILEAKVPFPATKSGKSTTKNRLDFLYKMGVRHKNKFSATIGWITATKSRPGNTTKIRATKVLIERVLELVKPVKNKCMSHNTIHKTAAGKTVYAEKFKIGCETR
ncbi:hypothetical protein [Bacillus sp. V59.32b]|uniref:hypothetical protein n=1 Tax=Bacillus sp. V59.32b TaxID=1758642 RepID=UPI000E3C9ECC|nr:hypothetical protein [Bacillus sp. V59.32b]RFU60670.1 hypothetical protein D0463_16330 [Bacillus sp. V59.32b]